MCLTNFCWLFINDDTNELSNDNIALQLCFLRGFFLKESPCLLAENDAAKLHLGEYLTIRSPNNHPSLSSDQQSHSVFNQTTSTPFTWSFFDRFHFILKFPSDEICINIKVVLRLGNATPSPSPPLLSVILEPTGGPRFIRRNLPFLSAMFRPMWTHLNLSLLIGPMGPNLNDTISNRGVANLKHE